MQPSVAPGSVHTVELTGPALDAEGRKSSDAECDWPVTGDPLKPCRKTADSRS